jgi:hypothetical protein
VIRIFARAFAIFGVRWVRSWGYRGRHPGWVILVCLVAAIGAAFGTAVWANGQFAGLIQQSRQFREALVAVVVLMLFFAAGPVLLLTESIRSSGSRIQAVLSALPLTGREITLLMWLPTFVVSVALLGLLWIPGFAAVSGLRYSTYESAIGSLLALLSGYCLAALIIALVRALLARSTWSGVQYPVMVLGWMAVTALEIWRAGTPFAASVLQTGDYVLLVPWLLQETVLESIPFVLVGVILAGTIAAIGLLVWSASLPSEGKHVSVVWQWSRRWRPPLVTLELTRILRSRHLVANLIGAEMIILGTSIALWRLPLPLRPFIDKPLLAFMMMTTALPLLAIRGLTKGTTPVPLLLGYGPVRWTASQLVAGVGLAVAAVLPGAIAFGVLGVPAATIVQWGVPNIVAACGVAIALGWSVPASADNPIGQIVGAFLLVLALGVVVIVADHAFTSGSLAWTVFLLAIGSLGVAWAVTLERDRWSRVTSSGARRVR